MRANRALHQGEITSSGERWTVVLTGWRRAKHCLWLLPEAPVVPPVSPDTRLLGLGSDELPWGAHAER